MQKKRHRNPAEGTGAERVAIGSALGSARHSAATPSSPSHLPRASMCVTQNSTKRATSCVRFTRGLVSLATHASRKTFRPDLRAVQHLDRPRRAAVGLRLHPLVVLAPGELVQRVVGQVRADVGGARAGGEHRGLGFE